MLDLQMDLLSFGHLSENSSVVKVLFLSQISLTSGTDYPSAMHALRIPTSRSLSLVHFPDLPVARETIETACVLTRIAPSFIRIGSFEALDPPQSVFLLGGGQQPAHYDALRILGEWVSRNVLKLKLDEDAPWGKALVLECAKRNASMVAGWQVYGFMHGVINTDKSVIFHFCHF